MVILDTICHVRAPQCNKMCPVDCFAAPIIPNTTTICYVEEVPIISRLVSSLAQMQAATARGPHRSAQELNRPYQLHAKVAEKFMWDRQKIMDSNDIMHDPQQEQKISPISIIPHMT